MSNPCTPATSPFRIGIIQDHADATSPATSAAPSVSSATRPAAARRSSASRSSSTRPYFCKSQHSDRFDLAEPIPGPTTDRLQALAKELAVVLDRAALRAPGRRRLPQLRRGHRRRRQPARRVSQDAHPRRSAVQREVLLHAGRHGHRASRTAACDARGFKVWKTRYATIGVLICWDQWYPEAARITSLLGAQMLFYPDRDRLASRREGRMGRRPGRRLADDAARARDRQRRLRRVAEPHRPRGRGRAPTASRSSATRSSAIRSAATSPRPATSEQVLIADCDPALIETVRRNWPFLRDRRIDAYDPILNRYLGS